MIHESVPAQLIAGDTWRILLDFGDYPAPTWVATLYFENQYGSFSSLGVASGSSHLFTVLPAATGVIAAGRYRWSARATDGTLIESIPETGGWLTVLTDPASTGNSDRRSWARRTLDALEATLEGRATSDQLAMSIAGRSISRIPLSELLMWRGQLRGEVRAEDQAAEAGLGRQIRVRLGRG